MILISPSPTKNKIGRDVLSVSKCLKREDVLLSPLLCEEHFKKLEKETNESEEQNWAIIGVSATNLVVLLINALLACKRGAPTDGQGAVALPVYHSRGSK